MSKSDFDFEPVKGLPAALPEGEHIIWQGAPEASGLAVRAFHVRKIAIYFGALMAWRMWAEYAEGATVAAALMHALFLLPFALAAISILWAIAWGYARTTVYTLTNKRFVLRSGIALPVTLNLPFARVDGASLKLFGDGTGDIPLTINKDDRIALLVIWPHARPWTWASPQPMLRSVLNAARVAEYINAALRGEPVRALQVQAVASQGSGMQEGDVKTSTQNLGVPEGHPA
jgi:Bacterial PH domain